MQENISICPYCKNQAYFDSRSSTSYCKQKSCRGLVIEQGKITYENEVNLHETDDHTKKQTRFGGYENKREAFKNQLCEVLGKKDSRSRKQFSDKFEEGEHLISKLSSIFKQNEAFTNEVISKYRAFIYDFAADVQNKSFEALAALSYSITVMERKQTQKGDSYLNKITTDHIVKFSKITQLQLEQVSKAVNYKTGQEQRSDVCQTIQGVIKNDHKLPFNDLELNAAKEIPTKLMNNSIIKGEKTATITCVIEYMVCQLSGNPELNKYTLDQLASLNEVTKDTAKKLWNTIMDSQQIGFHVPDWNNRKSINELKHMQ